MKTVIKYSIIVLGLSLLSIISYKQGQKDKQREIVKRALKYPVKQKLTNDDLELILFNESQL